MTSHAARSRAEAEAKRHTAIARLASARREKLTEQDFDVYCDGLDRYDAEIVVRVCRVLELETPGEYQPRFPDLPFIVARCDAELKRWREAQQRPRLALSDGDKPVDPAKWADFKKAVQRSLDQRHAMPRRGQR